MALGGCARSSEDGGDSAIRIVDHYNTPADDAAITTAFEARAAELGLTFSRERVPGDQLVAKVLQMGSSRTMPDLLMLDNPNVEQVAASGALAPLEQYGIDIEDFTPAVAELGMFEGTLSVVLPVSRNSLITAGIFSFLFAWDDFLMALTLTTGETIRPVTLGLYTYIGTNDTDWSAVMSTAVLSSLPAVVLMIIAQKHVAAGATGGAVK